MSEVTLDGNPPSGTLDGTEIIAMIKNGTDVSGAIDLIITLVNAVAQLASTSQVTGFNAAASAAAPVQSVAGRTGAVTLTESDIANLVADLAAKLNLSGGTLTGALLNYTATPTNSLELTPKSYVDSVTSAVINGLSPKISCRFASTGNLNATYNNGASGVGATLTNAGTLSAFTSDGITGNPNDRFFYKDASNQIYNGVYVLTTVGDASTPWVLTRASDFDNSPAGEVYEGVYTFVTEGSNSNKGIWYLTTTGTITIGTTALSFANGGLLVAGTGLTQLGNLILIADQLAAAFSLNDGSKTFNLSVNKQGQLIAIAALAIAITASQVSDFNIAVATIAALKANNLSDLTNASTARTNLGLGTAATQNSSTFLQVLNNLSDLNNAATARTNLGAAAANGLATLDANTFLNYAQIPVFNFVNITSGTSYTITTTDHGKYFVVNVAGGFTFNVPNLSKPICFKVTQDGDDSIVLNATGSMTFISKAGFTPQISGSGASATILFLNTAAAVVYGDVAPIFLLDTTSTSFNSLSSVYNGSTIRFTNAAGTTIILPSDSAGTVTPIGFKMWFIQGSSAQLTFSPASGVTINSRGNALKTRDINSVAWIEKIATSTYQLSGDLNTNDFLTIGVHAIPYFGVTNAVTNGASYVQLTESTTNKNNGCAWQFASSGNNYLHFWAPMPKSWSNATTFNLIFYWNTPGTSGNVVWNVQAVIRNNGSAYDLAFGSAGSVTSAANASANAIIEATTAAITPAGTGANNSIIEFRINRNGGSGSDTLANVANLIGWQLLMTVNAGNDA